MLSECWENSFPPYTRYVPIAPGNVSDVTLRTAQSHLLATRSVFLLVWPSSILRMSYQKWMKRKARITSTLVRLVSAMASCMASRVLPSAPKYASETAHQTECGEKNRLRSWEEYHTHVSLTDGHVRLLFSGHDTLLTINIDQGLIYGYEK